MKLFSSIFLFISIFLFAFFIFPQKTFAQLCPQYTDVGFDDDRSSCGPTGCTHKWSKRGTGAEGVNTWGGTLTCRCESDWSDCFGEPVTCVTRPDALGRCYGGTGGWGGFGDGCVKAPNAFLPVSCPAPYPLNIRVQNNNGVGVSGVRLNITYGGSPFAANLPGTTITRTTDGSGNISITNLIYSGMHFRIVPQNGQGTFTPSQMGQNVTVDAGALEMNTGWSCGTPTLGDGSANSQPTCIFTTSNPNISGNVFVDYNNNGVKDAEDGNFANAVVNVRHTSGSTQNDTTDNSGNFEFSVANGTYTISLQSIPAGYQLSTPPQITRTIPPNATNLRFGLTPLYTIRGIIYQDINKNKVFAEPPDQQYHADNTITFTGPKNTSITTVSNASYSSGQQLPAGTYTVSYTVPGNYSILYPGPPPSFSVTVGTPGKSIVCSVGGATSASCDMNGNINNLNFGISQSFPWIQSVCGDWREDNGITNKVPATGDCGGVSNAYAIVNGGVCTNSGMFFSGNSTSSFSPGNVSSHQWLIGGTTYPETFSPFNTGVVRTSYTYMTNTTKQAGVTLTSSGVDLSQGNKCGAGSIANCTLQANLPNGVYYANGNLALNAYTFPANRNYVLLVNGNLTIRGNILVPTGSSVIFSVKGDIVVDPAVGEATATSRDANIQGLYSTDKSFIINSSISGTTCNADGTPIDRRLNITGAIVVNAALQSPAGSFQNRRDLCSQNSCPAVSISLDNGNISGSRNGAGIGLSYLLNAPNFIKHKNYLWQEVAPGDPIVTPTPTPTPTIPFTPTPTPSPTPSPTPTPAALPYPWLTRDIGTVGIAGYASYASNTFTVRGSGDDIWNAADAFRYVYQPITGNRTIIARVTGLQNTNVWAKAGVMIRETLDANAKHVAMLITPGNGSSFQSRSTTGGSATFQLGPSATAPYWVKLSRSGNRFSGFVSNNGVNWVLVDSITLSMNNDVYIGLPVTSHNNAQLNTATFDNVSLSSQSPLLFFTGFDSGDPQLTWTNSVDDAGQPSGGISGVGGCCNQSSPESGTRNEKAHSAPTALMYSGSDNSIIRSFAYMKNIDLSGSPVAVGPNTVLEYWIYPQNKNDNHPSAGWLTTANYSSCVALDLIFRNSSNQLSNLRDSGAVDQNGNSIHPGIQCGKLTMNAWNHVIVNLGSVRNGTSITKIDQAYDQGPNTGAYRGYIDDISIHN